MLYFLIYVLYLLTVFLLSQFYKSFAKPIRFVVVSLSVIAFALIIGFRPETTRDTTTYIEVFYSEYYPSRFRDFFDVERLHGIEKTFIFLCVTFRKFFRSYRLFFVLIAFFNVTCSSYYLSRLVNENNKFIDLKVLFLYCSAYGMTYGGIVVRSGITITLGIMAVFFAKSRKILRMTLCLIAAYLIHHASIAFAAFCLLQLFFRRSNGNKTNFLFFAVSLSEAFFALLNVETTWFSFLSPLIESSLSVLNMNYFFSSYVSSSYGLSIGLTNVLLSVFVSALFFFIWLHNQRVNVGLMLTILIASFILSVFSGFRSLSRVYDMGLIFLIVPAYQLHRNLTESSSFHTLKISAYSVYFFLLEILLTLISFKTVFPEIVHL